MAKNIIIDLETEIAYLQETGKPTKKLDKAELSNLDKGKITQLIKLVETNSK